MGFQLGNEIVVFPDLPVDFLAMVVIIGQRRVHVGQRELREVGYNGYLTVECLGPEARDKPFETVRRDLEILTQYLRSTERDVRGGTL